MDPVYQCSKPVIQCGVCHRERRFWFVTALWVEPTLVVRGRRRWWENREEACRICGPTCAEHFATFNTAPMYDRYGMEIRRWLETRAQQPARRAA